LRDSKLLRKCLFEDIPCDTIVTLAQVQSERIRSEIKVSLQIMFSACPTSTLILRPFLREDRHAIMSEVVCMVVCVCA
jgi:hypothetical protein